MEALWGTARIRLTINSTNTKHMVACRDRGRPGVIEVVLYGAVFEVEHFFPLRLFMTVAMTFYVK